MLGHLSAPAELVRGDERFPRGARSGARKPELGREKVGQKSEKKKKIFAFPTKIG
jgi:hypothetical protein